jgi:uncharacterized protein YndB with AHSA1/START domain
MMGQLQYGEGAMIEEERSIVISRPIEEVFAYVSDLRHSAEWQAGLSEVRKVTYGPLGVGTRFVAVRKLMGRKLQLSSQFVAYEPNRMVVFRFSGSVPGEGSYVFESTVEGTSLTSRVEMQPRGFARLAEPLIAASLRRQMEANLPALRDLLEERAAT